MRVRRIRHQAERDATIDDACEEAKKNGLRSALTEAEAARFIGMSAAWLKKSRTQRFRNVIDAPPFVRAGSKRVVYRLEDLDAWQERHLEHVGPMRGIAPARKSETRSYDPTETGSSDR